MSADMGKWLPDDAISPRASAHDWRAAVRLAGDALERSGATTAAYTDEMIAAIDELGPYIVIAPGIALAHSRPSPAVVRGGLSVVTLRTPVEFGNEANDPVSLVIGLAALDHEAHLEIMSKLAQAISDEAVVQAILRADEPAPIRELILGSEPS